MISELRKMKDVFTNYCQLNDKVYKKIIEHELNVANQFQKANGLAVSMEGKINDAVSEIKDLHESTQRENIRSK